MKLGSLQDHFFNLYGRRNRIFLPGLRERIDFLGLAVADLQDVIRKIPETSKIEIALTRVMARVFCVGEHFLVLPLIETLIAKYPSSHCSYCGRFPCLCSEIRQDSQLTISGAGLQNEWNLRQWQQHFNALYGVRNKEKGVENVLNRLFKEVSELSSLQLKVPYMNCGIGEIEKEFALELSDVFAWTIAMANVLGIDLQKAVLDRFGNGCQQCRQLQCICVHFNVDPVRWSTLTI